MAAKAFREPLGRERVLAAVVLADAEGVKALTMRRLAADLDVEAMSLYYHLPGKEALLDGVVETVVAEIHDRVGRLDTTNPAERPVRPSARVPLPGQGPAAPTRLTRSMSGPVRTSPLSGTTPDRPDAIGDWRCSTSGRAACGTRSTTAFRHVS
ncbi:TetR family transcriptional regulator [Nonomuraea sp. NPDC049269]|uniref:TetR family transcriptional regulator n=1 Tax=Nonomuraea sp. NPDC049269 TaxID=3364349 RepID=UPI003720CCA4